MTVSPEVVPILDEAVRLANSVLLLDEELRPTIPAEPVDPDPPTVPDLINGGAGVFDGVGDGAADNLAAWNAFVSNHDYVVIPAGEYLFSAPMKIPSRKTVLGMGGGDSTTFGSRIKGTAGQVAAVQLGEGTIPDGQDIRFKGFCITGKANKAVFVNRAFNLNLDEIHLKGEFTDGFVFYYTWGSQLHNLRTNGAVITENCFRTSDAYSANDASNWYTVNNCPVNFLLDGGGSGNTWTNLCAQGGRRGLWAKAVPAGTINGFYSENVVRAMQLGDSVSSRMAEALTINSPMLGSPYDWHPEYGLRDVCLELDYAFNVTINSPWFNGAFKAGGWATVAFSGGGGSGALAVARVTKTGMVHSIHVLRGGSGFTSAPTVAIAGAGTGATATASIASGSVAAVNVSSPGTGYVPKDCPVAVRYKYAQDVTIVSPRMNPMGNSVTAAFYPWIVRATGAPSSAGVTLLSTFTQREATEAAIGEMRKSQGNNFKHFLTEIDANGVDVRWPYVPVEMAA